MSRAATQPEVADTSMQRPHLVLLGAGASLAAFPEGDANGRRLPLMNNLVEVVGLGPLLERNAVEFRNRSFEDVYSGLCSSARHAQLRAELETTLVEYFAALELPDEPTLYDRLILSLRPKDFIATFNWDPFLWLAAARNCDLAEPPHLLFLHGNVAVGYCLEHQRKGPARGHCSVCRARFSPSPLLYPVREKDYSQNAYIKSEWDTIAAALEAAYIFTIFGYSAPKSDLDAVGLLREAWGSPGRRNLEEIEIIDIVEGDVLAARWSKFIHSHHYRTATAFDESWIARHPRRSCEVMWNMLMEVQWPEDNWLPACATFRELRAWLAPLVQAGRRDV